MLRLGTVAQSQEVDDLSQRVYGLTGEILMEAAGSLAAREVDQSFFPEINRGMTSIICGPGNNGGDGLVLARHMHSAGYRDLEVFTLVDDNRQSSLFKIQLRRAELHGLRIVDLAKNPEKIKKVKSSALIIDALFGIGLSRNLEDRYLQMVDLINSVKCPVVSLDCPSGLNCDRGEVLGTCVKATMTLSFGLAKPGFFVWEGPLMVGKLRVLPIGFPHEALRGVATTHFLFNEKLAKRYLPTRSDLTNKSDFGGVLIAAGREGMWGAGILASASAFRMGAGYVIWASHISPSENLKQIPEVMTASLEAGQVFDHEKINTIAIGPGLGVCKETADLIRQLKKIPKKAVVVDADGISSCVAERLFPLPEHWVITPHAGELSKIIDWDVKTIERDRYSAALEGSKVAGCHVLFKGYRSIMAYQNRAMVINSGNSSLAKAGTGDVLTGMIASLLAQGLEPVQATSTAAYIHGRMADEWVRIGNDKRTLNASDLKDHLPSLLGRIAAGSL